LLDQPGNSFEKAASDAAVARVAFGQVRERPDERAPKGMAASLAVKMPAYSPRHGDDVVYWVNVS
jgi:hypothetical protein